MRKEKRAERAAVIVSIFILIQLLLCLLYLVRPFGESHGCIAQIYQDGELIQSIPLFDVQQTYIYTVTGSDGCCNQIEVRPGSIGIISADCPDKLCVHQGFISDSKLPITCLPNRLVIQLVPTGQETSDSATTDISTY